MIFRKLISGIFFLVCAGMTISYAQQTVNSTGDDVSGAGGTVSYSVGQNFYQAQTGTNGTVINGVQQPYEISVVTSYNKPPAISLSCEVFPNPVSTCLTLKFEDVLLAKYTIILYDNAGKIVLNKRIQENESSLDMKNLIPATYFLKVLETNQGLAPKEIKTFKIIKN